MRTALVGRRMLQFDAPKLIRPVPQAGRMIELVDDGKHLEVTWDDRLVLDTYLKETGQWRLSPTRVGDARGINCGLRSRPATGAAVLASTRRASRRTATPILAAIRGGTAQARSRLADR